MKRNKIFISYVSQLVDKTVNGEKQDKDTHFATSDPFNTGSLSQKN